MSHWERSSKHVERNECINLYKNKWHLLKHVLLFLYRSTNTMNVHYVQETLAQWLRPLWRSATQFLILRSRALHVFGFGVHARQVWPSGVFFYFLHINFYTSCFFILMSSPYLSPGAFGVDFLKRICFSRHNILFLCSFSALLPQCT